MTLRSKSPNSVAKAFVVHSMPANALPVRCHVLDGAKAKAIEDYLVQELPWCYASKTHIKNRARSTGKSAREIIANRLPDPGSVMSGDFGEITTMFFLASERVEATLPVKKWHYKQDRTKAAPLTDVIIIYRADADKPTKDDFVICAETKQKATASAFDPISQAVEGFRKDSTGRLARTLTWLREKAIDQEAPERIALIERFTSELATEYGKFFKAVAVVDRSLLNDELTRQVDLPKQDTSFEVIVLGISDLKTLYERVFQRAQAEINLE